MAPGSTAMVKGDPPSFDVSLGDGVTAMRMPAVHADRYIAKPGVPRANAAVSSSMPNGEPAYTKEHNDHTVLQQHILFWDRDTDGQIFPWNTYVGFRELGFNIIFSFIAMVIIHSGFAYPTRLAHSYIPDPFFRIYVNSIHKAKHGSDSETYDTEGRFRPQQFEDMFAKYDRRGDGTLTFLELLDLIKGNRNVVDPFGWGAAIFEFGTTWLLIQKDGKVYKDDVRGVYDGSIFFRIREQRGRKAGWHQGFGLGGDGFIGARKSERLSQFHL